MGRNSQQRRTASSSWPDRALDQLDHLDVTDLVGWGARASFGTMLDDELREQIVARLILAPTTHGQAPDRVAVEAIVVLLVHRWESGWLPLDLVHVIRHEFSPRAARLAAALVLDDASLRSPDRPAAWDDQMAAVVATSGSRFVGSVSAVERWRRAEKVTLADALRVALQIMGFVITLPPVPVVLDPPSQWARLAAVPRLHAAGTGAVDAKLVDRIRALLAKAEASGFPAEAESFTSKAQELMSRHAIDTAMLSSGASSELGTEVRSRRVHIDDPYAFEKAQLLGAVAMSNNGRVVWDQQFGWATVVGFAVDLDLIELLFTSLLIQLTRAIGDAGRSGGRAKSPAFRRAFVLSYANRIAERLTEAQLHAQGDAQQQYGVSLVPVLAARTEAVDLITERLFPHLRESRMRQVDAQGWRAGRIAADIATLHAGSGMIQT